MGADTETKIIKRLSELEKGEGGLPLLLQFYHGLFLVQAAARRRIGAPRHGLTGEAIRERLQRGAPLLGVDDLNLDPALVRELFVKVRGVFSGYPGLFGDIPAKPETGHAITGEAIKAWFDGGELPRSAQDGVGETTMRAMIHFTIKPLLTAYAESFAPSIEPEQWRRRYCPVCGGIPDMAFLDKERGARWLLCSRCDYAWLFHRLQCPGCGTQDQNALAFFTDDKELYRLHVCERCKCYLKTIDLRRADGEVLMPLERLLTVDMDKQALAAGYRLPG